VEPARNSFVTQYRYDVTSGWELMEVQKSTMAKYLISCNGKYWY